MDAASAPADSPAAKRPQCQNLVEWRCDVLYSDHRNTQKMVLMDEFFGASPFGTQLAIYIWIHIYIYRYICIYIYMCVCVRVPMD